MCGLLKYLQKNSLWVSDMHLPDGFLVETSSSSTMTQPSPVTNITSTTTIPSSTPFSTTEFRPPTTSIITSTSSTTVATPMTIATNPENVSGQFHNCMYGSSDIINYLVKTFWSVSISFAELYFQVKVNVSITGGCDLEQILRSWVSLTEHPSSYFKIQETIFPSPG